MTTILQINSSLHGEDAQSSRLAADFVAALRDGRAAPRRHRDRSRPFARACPAPDGRALPGVRHPGRRTDARPAAARRRVRRAGRGAAARGRDRHRPADVQLRRAVDAQGLLRSRGARRRDLPLHRRGPGGPAQGQEGLRVRDARRAPRRHARRTCRPRTCGSSWASSASGTSSSSTPKGWRSARSSATLRSPAPSPASGNWRPGSARPDTDAP